MNRKYFYLRLTASFSENEGSLIFYRRHQLARCRKRHIVCTLIRPLKVFSSEQNTNSIVFTQSIFIWRGTWRVVCAVVANNCRTHAFVYDVNMSEFGSTSASRWAYKLWETQLATCTWLCSIGWWRGLHGKHDLFMYRCVHVCTCVCACVYMYVRVHVCRLP